MSPSCQLKSNVIFRPLGLSLSFFLVTQTIGLHIIVNQCMCHIHSFVSNSLTTRQRIRTVRAAPSYAELEPGFLVLNPTMRHIFWIIFKQNLIEIPWKLWRKCVLLIGNVAFYFAFNRHYKVLPKSIVPSPQHMCSSVVVVKAIKNTSNCHFTLSYSIYMYVCMCVNRVFIYLTLSWMPAYV